MRALVDQERIEVTELQRMADCVLFERPAACRLSR